MAKRIVQTRPLEYAQNQHFESFYYIFGSSSGALIAIMLGRLEMSLNDSKDRFREYSGDIFRHPRFSYRLFGGLGPHIFRTPRYSEKRVVDAAQNVVKTFNPKSASTKYEQEMFRSSNNRCRTGVFSAYLRRNGKGSHLRPFVFRTYHTPTQSTERFDGGRYRPRLSNDEILPGGVSLQQGCNDVPIWQVARAACAAPNYFAPVSIDDRSFVDGGYPTSNLTTQAHSEVLAINMSSQTSSYIALVSIGSGGTPPKANPKARGIITATRQTHNLALIGAGIHDTTYFRFEVPELDIRFDEWRPSTISYIVSKTEEYLNREAVAEKLQACADVLFFQWYFRTRKRLAARLKMQRDRYFNHSPPEVKLHLAVKRRDADATRGLLEQGVDVNACDHEGETPLFITAKDGNVEMMKLLLESGAKPDHESKWGRTPLAFAAQNGHAEVARLLLNAGANPRAQSYFGRTPLSLAAENGHKALLRILYIALGMETLADRDRGGDGGS
ncbi:hypothetical protein GGR51DRAFT_578054 [Nemania sp. FL0031]|nr:hypothetical protein GGR51DRAFT_578054 [Nemania sp. FL0031]